MNPRTTGILFLVAAALFAFVYFYEIRGEEGRKEAEAAEKRLFPDVEQDDVAILSLTTSDGRDAMLERTEDGWALTSPVRFPADALAADGMADAIAQLASESVFEEPQGPEVYGLDVDRKEVQFTADGTARTLRFGDKTPVGSNSYATTGDGDAVYAVPSHRADAFSKSLDDLREKRVLRFEASSIDRISASWPGGGLAIERRDGVWHITEPIEAEADQETVDGLLSDLSFLRATGFVDDPPPDPEVGLDAPDFAVVLEGAGETDGDAEDDATPIRLTFSLGADLDGVSRLARAGETVLYRIPAERIDDFPRDASVYRFRRLAEFASTSARRLEIVFHTSDGETLAITGSRDESGWSATPESFQPGKLASLVSEVSRLKANRILADGAGEAELAGLGLDPPNALYRIYGQPEGEGDAEDEDAPEELLAEIHIGTLQGADGIVARSGGREEIFQLPYELGEHLPVSYEAFGNRFRREPDPEPAPDAEAADAFEALDAPPLAPEPDLGGESP